MKLNAAPKGLQGARSGPLRPCAMHRRPLRCTAVLQEDPRVAEDVLRARLERLLPPSTREQLESDSALVANKLPPRYLEPNSKDTVWYFSYGANMSFSTLSRRGVRPLSRAPAVLVEPNIHVVFQHRGGA